MARKKSTTRRRRAPARRRSTTTRAPARRKTTRRRRRRNPAMNDLVAAGLAGVGVGVLQIAAEKQNLESEKIGLAMAAVGVLGSIATKKTNKALSAGLAAAGLGFATTAGYRYYEQKKMEKSMSGMGAVVTPIGRRRGTMGALGPKDVTMNAVVTPIGRRNNPADVTMNGWG